MKYAQTKSTGFGLGVVRPPKSNYIQILLGQYILEIRWPRRVPCHRCGKPAEYTCLPADTPEDRVYRSMCLCPVCNTEIIGGPGDMHYRPGSNSARRHFKLPVELQWTYDSETEIKL